MQIQWSERNTLILQGRAWSHCCLGEQRELAHRGGQDSFQLDRLCPAKYCHLWNQHLSESLGALTAFTIKMPLPPSFLAHRRNSSCLWRVWISRQALLKAGKFLLFWTNGGNQFRNREQSTENTHGYPNAEHPLKSLSNVQHFRKQGSYVRV